MKQVMLTNGQARKIILHAGALSGSAPFGTGREAVLRAINHLGYVQLDTNHTVERAHHHTLAARVPDYRNEWLAELQDDGLIYEFLTSDSGFIPMDDYRFSIPVQQAFTKRYANTSTQELNGMQRVLDRIERDGPVKLSDFDNDRTEASSGWWDWRPAKIFLERLYLQGKIMATRDQKFHKLYDLPINILPKEIDRTAPTPEEYARHIIRLTLRSLGIAYVKEMNWRARFVRDNIIKTEVEKMVAEGEVLHVAIKDHKGKQLYMLPGYESKKIKIEGKASILSPFDPAVVFRHRLKDFFGFDYQVECFVPAPKRKYGYFSLPVLLGDRFVARMDSKADRKEQVLMIHNLHFEDVQLTEQELATIAAAISHFAGFNKCNSVKIVKCNKRNYLKSIRLQHPSASSARR